MPARAHLWRCGADDARGCSAASSPSRRFPRAPKGAGSTPREVEPVRPWACSLSRPGIEPVARLPTAVLPRGQTATGRGVRQRGRCPGEPPSSGEAQASARDSDGHRSPSWSIWNRRRIEAPGIRAVSAGTHASRCLRDGGRHDGEAPAPALVAQRVDAVRRPSAAAGAHALDQRNASGVLEAEPHRDRAAGGPDGAVHPLGEGESVHG